MGGQYGIYVFDGGFKGTIIGKNGAKGNVVRSWLLPNMWCNSVEMLTALIKILGLDL